ncbi:MULTISPECIES: flagellar basal body rod protein FlgB [Bacillus cereus group]|uniref:Flagellar basal body rod protein FlgB n=2 Tax=Bacillus cereus group TaxID=86661 RepID=A0A9X6SSE8_BACCE|nr:MULTISPECIES: flagellar basal body rod protein FlgB [Bacillus cereus group]MDA1674899.1 flagellar basal body rod protein FlgB [Bacillus cereus group sp. TH152-1LC]PDZ94271.1 flagellar basal body rod protein FlgB [Bacillus cereus]PFJ31016.1 flagellar basal body rod protein FlgB [Bacillus thuringiensis]PGP12820.1 flagellar basal body rod protein FlgB [Bacillus cereus]
MSYVDDLSGVMSYSVRKRETISNNISNQTTPNYKAQVVRWNDALEGDANSLKVTNEGHIPLNQNGEKFTIQSDNETEVRSDGNSVDLNKEIVEMMKNNQIFSLSLNALNSYYESMGAARGK